MTDTAENTTPAEFPSKGQAGADPYSIPLDQIQSIDVYQGKLAGKMLITFADGTSVDFDIVKTSGPGPFADKFTELTGR